MSKITVTTTRTFSARRGQFTASVEVVGGKFTRGRLCLNTGSSFDQLLYFKNLKQLRDANEATQALLEAISSIGEKEDE